MKPTIKNKGAEKPKFLSALKQKLFPSPEVLVKNMSYYNSYPYGKSLDQISNKIVRTKALSPEQKIDLLLDAYGKYYIYQHERVTNFATYEFYYEEFMLEYNGQEFKHSYRYQKRFDELSAEHKYIVNRNFDEDMKDVLSQAKNQGILSETLGKLDPLAITAIKTASQLKDDYAERLDENVYRPDENEKKLEELFAERYNAKIRRKDLQKEPFPEFDKTQAQKEPSQSSSQNEQSL